VNFTFGYLEVEAVESLSSAEPLTKPWQLMTRPSLGLGVVRDSHVAEHPADREKPQRLLHMARDKKDTSGSQRMIFGGLSAPPCATLTVKCATSIRIGSHAKFIRPTHAMLEIRG